MSILRKAKTFCRISKSKLKCLLAKEYHSDTYSHAFSILSNYSPMPASTPICNHKWQVFEYDLTIIIPAFNAERWIKHCLDSAVQQQTNFTYQVIVVDDGSTDNTAELIDSYSNFEKVRIIHQENKGYSGARNTALNIISGEYVMFLDSDDYIMPDAVEILMSTAKQKNAEIVESNGFTFNEQGRIAPIKDKINRLWGGPCLKVMKSSLWKNIEFPDGYIYEDTIISYLIGKQSRKTVFIPDELYAYRIHDDSITQKRDENPKRVDSFWILQLVLGEQEKLNISIQSDEDYIQVMRHVIFTYRRTAKLPDEIKRSIFSLTKFLLKGKYLDYDYKNSLNHLVKAIQGNNYGRYCAICDTINLSKI